ncbi:hypothetical protein THAOC_36992, partial [Thalassiosira oceanica]
MSNEAAAQAAESADLAALSLHHRLMASGHERPEDDRTLLPDNDASSLEMIQKRVGKGDVVAINHLAEQHCQGKLGLARMSPRQSRCGQRLQSLDQWRHTTFLAAGTTL